MYCNIIQVYSNRKTETLTSVNDKVGGLDTNLVRKKYFISLAKDLNMIPALGATGDLPLGQAT